MFIDDNNYGNLKTPRYVPLRIRYRRPTNGMIIGAAVGATKESLNNWPRPPKEKVGPSLADRCAERSARYAADSKIRADMVGKPTVQETLMSIAVLGSTTLLILLFVYMYQG